MLTMSNSSGEFTLVAFIKGIIYFGCRILTDPIGTEYPESEETQGIRGWDSLILTSRDSDTKLTTEGRPLEEVEQYSNPEFETVDFG